jgi:hypothetical protein
MSGSGARRTTHTQTHHLAQAQFLRSPGALGTRYDKLAVNYIALWIVANIHRLLKKRLRFLQTGLSETT